MTYTFKCDCGSTTLEEILVNVTQATAFRKVISDDDIHEPAYLESSNEGGEVERYQCMKCGRVLKANDGSNIRNPRDLIKHGSFENKP